jgi:hypothetical protein
MGSFISHSEQRPTKRPRTDSLFDSDCNLKAELLAIMPPSNHLRLKETLEELTFKERHSINDDLVVLKTMEPLAWKMIHEALLQGYRYIRWIAVATRKKVLMGAVRTILIIMTRLNFSTCTCEIPNSFMSEPATSPCIKRF